MKIHQCKSKFYSGSYSAYCSCCGHDFGYGESHERFCEKATISDKDNASVIALLGGLVQDIIEASPQWKWETKIWDTKTTFNGHGTNSIQFLCIRLSGSKRQSNTKNKLDVWIDGNNLCIQPVLPYNEVNKICLNNPRHIDEIVNLLEKFKGE